MGEVRVSRNFTVIPSRIRPRTPWPVLGQDAGTKEVEEDADTRALRATLAASGLPDARQDLLFNLGLFHKREAKPAQWAVRAAKLLKLTNIWAHLSGLVLSQSTALRLYLNLVCVYDLPVARSCRLSAHRRLATAAELVRRAAAAL